MKYRYLNLVRSNKHCYLDTLDTFTEQLVVAVISLIILVLTKTINSRLTQKLPRILITSSCIRSEEERKGINIIRSQVFFLI